MTKQIQNKVNLQFIEKEMLSHRTERGEIGKKTENRKPHYTNFL